MTVPGTPVRNSERIFIMKKVSTAELRAEAEKIVSGIELPRIPAAEYRLAPENFSDIRDLLNSALKKCSGSGGGKVVLPAGRYRCSGPIVMQSRTELHLEEGCFVKFSPEPSLYLPVVPARWEGIELMNYSPLIYGKDLTDVALTGKGIFSGGRELWKDFPAQQKADQQRTRTLEAEKLPLEKRVFGDGCFLRPPMIQIRDSERLLFEGITCIDAPMWMLHPLYCSHVTIRDICMDSMYVCNDGVDVDSCTDVLIEKSHFRNGDDAVVLKAGRDADGLRVNRPNRRIVVRDCVFHECLHGFAIGSELSGGAEDVYVYDIRMEFIKWQAISFKSAPGRGGVIRRIHVWDIQVDKTNDHIISIVSEYPGVRTGTVKTCYRDFDLVNIHCNYAKNGFYLEGSAELPLQDIRLIDVEVDKADVPISGDANTGTLSFENVRINGEEMTR